MTVPPEHLQRLADHSLRLPPRIDLGVVEEVDTRGRMQRSCIRDCRPSPALPKVSHDPYENTLVLIPAFPRRRYCISISFPLEASTTPP